MLKHSCSEETALQNTCNPSSICIFISNRGLRAALEIKHTLGTTYTSEPKFVDLIFAKRKRLREIHNVCAVLTLFLQCRQIPKRMQHILGFSSSRQQKPHLSPTVSPNISAWNGKKENLIRKKLFLDLMAWI